MTAATLRFRAGGAGAGAAAGGAAAGGGDLACWWLFVAGRHCLVGRRDGFGERAASSGWRLQLGFCGRQAGGRALEEACSSGRTAGEGGLLVSARGVRAKVPSSSDEFMVVTELST
jgi:hypothetical protein